MVVKKHNIAIHYSNVHHLVRYKLEAKAKVPRPSNPKKTKPKSENLEAEQEKGSENLSRNTGVFIKESNFGWKMKHESD